jgi:hypothetical protein
VKKSTLIRNDKPHAVKMAEGTHIAQRKSAKKASAPEEPTAPTPNTVKITPATRAKSKPVAVPAPTAKPVRSKASLREATPPPAPSRPNKPSKAAKPRPAPQAAAKGKTPRAAAPAPASEPVWEQDNPIKGRIEKLKTRNAQLAEQLQRLQNSNTARGQRP